MTRRLDPLTNAALQRQAVYALQEHRRGVAVRCSLELEEVPGLPDVKPPRFAASESQTLLTFPIEDGLEVGEHVSQYKRAIASDNDIVRSTASLTQRCAGDGYADVDLRWVLVHMIEETARHAGHADIIREQLDGVTGG